MREDDAAERAAPVIVEPGIGGDFRTVPQHDRLPAGLVEDRLLDLLAPPPELLVERFRPPEVTDPEGDETDSLIHATDRTLRTRDRMPPKRAAVER